MKRFPLIVVLFLSVYSHAQVQLGKNDLDELKNRLEGNFDSREQSQLDLDYQNISLHIKEIELKGKHSEGYWLYMEQSLTTTPSKLIQQQVYRLYKKDKETLACEVYELNNASQYAGAWSDVELVKRLRIDSLTEKIGCAIFFHKDVDGNFYGNTTSKECNNSLQGATYATTEMILYPNLLISWERAFDKDDKQVWGKEKGGYRFRKWTTPRKSDD